MFMLATLNPGGRKARRRKVRISRRRKGGRGLTPWQRAVKRHGGVMAAVKARRKTKRRRSAVSRRSLRSRPRMKKKEVIMARTRRGRRRRKALSRGRGGRFVSRRNGGRRRGRRARKNSWFKQPIRHARAAKLGHRRRARRYQANSAVVPVSWNPRRKRSRRSYRRNSPVLPYFAMNPAGVVGDIVGKVKSFLDVKFLTGTAVPALGGFLATKVLGNTVADLIGGFVKVTPLDKSFVAVKIGSQALTAAGLSWAVGRFVGRQQGQAVFLGGALAVLHAILREIVPTADQAKYGLLDGIGSDLSARMRDAVSKRLESRLNGFGTYLNQSDMRRQSFDGMGTYANVTDLQRQPAYAPAPTADLQDYDPASNHVSL